MKRAVYIVLFLIAGFAVLAAKTDAGAEFFDSEELRTFKITLGKEQYAALADNNRNRKYVSATVAVGGVTYSNVAVRLKGMGSFRPVHEKPSFAVKFDVADKDKDLFLAAGTAGDAAIYTDHAAALHILRKVILRVGSYTNYLILKLH